MEDQRTRSWLVVAGAALVLVLSAGVAQAVFGSLAFVEREKDGAGGVDGLDATDAVAISPDGANLYVAGQNDSAVASFSRDPATGGLTFIEFEQDGQNGVDGIAVSAGVAVSPDGQSVYVSGANDNAVATFSREASGALDFVEFEKDGMNGVDGLASPRDVEVSADGAHVYVASVGDAAVSSFARDPGNGTLTFIDVEKDGVGGVDGLAGASGISISPDGAHVYVTGANEAAIAAFSRNPGTGALTFVEFEKDGQNGVDGLAGANGLVTSPDGAHVYVAARLDNAVATFSRNPATGALAFVERDKDGVGGVDGLDGANGVAVSPDGSHVYVTGSADNAVATFSRDPATGALTFVERDKDGVGGVDGLAGAQFLTTSPDGAHTYVTGRNDDSVVAFAREGPPSDADPPETTITKRAPNKTGKHKVKFKFTSDEPGSTFECKLDKKRYKPCSSPKKLKRLKRGKHKFKVRAIDTAGNVDPSAAKDKFKVVG